MNAPVDAVVLVNADGERLGQVPRLEVHTTQTPLHLAFSLYAFDPDGRLLLTRRALGKRTWAGVWTNTCCGHPRPEEEITEAVVRRLGEELALQVDDLRCALPEFAYRATDASGIVENEICPVFVAGLAPGAVPVPDPDEVMDWSFVDPADLLTSATATPFAFSPWAVLQVRELAAVGALRR
ncbi:MAG: isopentenyl-diphosphate Delta-isomerase [Propionibacteriaceae bacterium]